MVKSKLQASSPRLEIADQLLNQINKNSSCELISFPGNGAGYLVENILKNNSLDYQFLDDKNSSDQTLHTVNIFRLNSPNFSSQLDTLDKFFQLANSQQKFIVINETPSFSINDKYLNSYAKKHIYLSLFLPVNSPNDTFQMISHLNPDLINKSEEIQTTTGGICRLIKLICSQPHLLSTDLDIEKCQIVEPIFSIVQSLNISTLYKLGLCNSPNSYKSTWLNNYYKKHKNDKPHIQFNNDLTIVESNQPNQNIFTKNEIDIINQLTTHEITSRDQIASIKWGNLHLEKYSDEAINKTISRINSKLSSHQIKSIPKLGYKLISKT